MNRSDEPVIQTTGLTKYYGRRLALNQVDLAVQPGQVVALLGRNGSGKSTLVRLLLGLDAPTRGTSRVLGVDSTRLDPQTRGRIGYLAEGHPVYGGMRVDRYAAFERSFHTRWDAAVFDRVIDYFRIRPKQKARQLSRGQRGGLSLALTLAADPDLMVFDDPALGLDPVARRSLLEAMLYASRRSDRTILFSTHDLADVERVADRLVVIDRGVLRADCPADTFRERVRRVVLGFGVGGVPEIGVDDVPGVLQVRGGDTRAELTLVVGEDGELTAAQHAALSMLTPKAVDVQPLALDQAITAYLDERDARPGFFEQMDRPVRNPVQPAARPQTMEVVS